MLCYCYRIAHIKEQTAVGQFNQIPMSKLVDNVFLKERSTFEFELVFNVLKIKITICNWSFLIMCDQIG